MPPGKVPIANPPPLPDAPFDAAAWAALVGRRLVIDVPASTANLGAGYDCLGLALDVCNTVAVEAVDGDGGIELEVTGEGEGELPPVRSNRFVAGARECPGGLDRASPRVDRLADRHAQPCPPVAWHGLVRGGIRGWGVRGVRAGRPQAHGAAAARSWRRRSRVTPTTRRRRCWADSWCRPISMDGWRRCGSTPRTDCGPCCSSRTGGCPPRTCAASSRPKSRCATPSAT